MRQITFDTPRFHAQFSIKQDNNHSDVFTYEGEVPEKIMDAYREVVGDGQAKVSVSADFSLKEFGKGVSSMATVTLTCGQDESSIRRAYQLAGELAREFAHQNASQASQQIGELVSNPGVEPGGPNFRR